MRGVDVPVANLRSFVVIEMELRAQLNFFEPVEIKSEIYRRVVSRITAQDDQRFDFAGVNVTDEFAQRLRLIELIGFDWIGIEDCFADVAQKTIRGVRQRVN